MRRPGVRWCLYGRVSTKDQSSENQRLEIERAGYKVDYWYADEGVSGKVSAGQRRQFAKMLGQIRDGETLVVSKLDAWAVMRLTSAPQLKRWPPAASRLSFCSSAS